MSVSVIDVSYTPSSSFVIVVIVGLVLDVTYLKSIVRMRLITVRKKWMEDKIVSNWEMSIKNDPEAAAKPGVARFAQI